MKHIQTPTYTGEKGDIYQKDCTRLCITLGPVATNAAMAKEISDVLNLHQELTNALNAMLVGCDKDLPESFPGHTEAYLRTVAIPRAKEALEKARALQVRL